MKNKLFLILSLLIATYSYSQSRKNYIKPIDKSGFIVDSILSLKGNIISYLLAGTEFDIEKSKVSYIEHSLLGHIDITDEAEANASATPIPEPEFYGEAFICNFDDNTYVEMERAIGQVKTKEQIWGPEMKLYVKPSSSPARVSKGHLEVIIRVPNIEDDPYSFIKISKFSTSVTRKLSLARQNDLTGKITYGGYNNQEIPFKAKKYGQSSFLLSFNADETGEYCITISNPNKIDGKLALSCFGVDEY